MTSPFELKVLTYVALATALMWLPYTLALIVNSGLAVTMGNRDRPLPPLPLWAQRAKRAHANAIENLVVFAPLTLVASMVHVSAPLLAWTTMLYLLARVAHYIIYAAGIPVVRTLLFFTGWIATLVIGASILSTLSQ